jgi:hypothetical protein
MTWTLFFQIAALIALTGGLTGAVIIAVLDKLRQIEVDRGRG